MKVIKAHIFSLPGVCLWGWDPGLGGRCCWLGWLRGKGAEVLSCYCSTVFRKDLGSELDLRPSEPLFLHV